MYARAKFWIISSPFSQKCHCTVSSNVLGLVGQQSWIKYSTIFKWGFHVKSPVF